MTGPQDSTFDVVAFGELVIDLIPAGTDGGEPLYAARAGGAPGNVAAGVARLGRSAAMLTKVGREPFGDLAVRTLAEAGVETRFIRRAEVETTSIAVVSVNAEGDRDFALYRADCADASYAAAEVADEAVAAARFLHVGSLSLATPISAEAQRATVGSARAAGGLVSADPNLRPAIWRDRRAMVAAGREAIMGADIVKLGEEELTALSGTADEGDAVRNLWHKDLRLMAVTRGAAGATLLTDGWRIDVRGFAVAVVDTVGCGDAFMASLLVSLADLDLDRLDRAAMAQAGRRAAAAGAVMATQPGAMARMPRAAEIEALLASGTEARR